MKLTKFKRRETEVQAVQWKEGAELKGVIPMPYESGRPGCGLFQQDSVQIILHPTDWLVFDGPDHTYSLPDSTFRMLYDVPEKKAEKE